MNIFEQLAIEEIKKIIGMTVLTMIFVLVILIFAISIFRKMKAAETDPTQVYNMRISESLKGIAIIVVTLIVFKLYSATGLFKQAYSEVASITGPYNVEVQVDDHKENLYLKSGDRSEQAEILSQGIAETTGQRGFEKILKINKISETRYEIFYKCKCGKEKSLITEE